MLEDLWMGNGGVAAATWPCRFDPARLSPWDGGEGEEGGEQCDSNDTIRQHDCAS